MTGDDMLTLDHIAVLGETLEEAAAHAEAALGMPLQPGGTHARYGTHNRVLGLQGDLYIEAIAIDPAAPPPQDPRWFGLDLFSGAARLDKWICRVPDMKRALEILPEAGRPVALSRGDLSWTMAVPESGDLPFDGLFPALIQWHSPVPAGAALPSSGCALTRLDVRHPEAAALGARLAPFLDTPLVVFETAQAPDLRAYFDTSAGVRVLQ